MQETCYKFECVSKNHCNDYPECSDVQCQFEYDCEFCVYQDECGAEMEAEGE